MHRQLCAFAVQVPDLRHIVRLEDAAMHDQKLVAGGGELLHGGAADEPRAAQNDDSQRRTTLRLYLLLPAPSRAREPRSRRR